MAALTAPSRVTLPIAPPHTLLLSDCSFFSFPLQNGGWSCWCAVRALLSEHLQRPSSSRKLKLAWTLPVLSSHPPSPPAHMIIPSAPTPSASALRMADFPIRPCTTLHQCSPGFVACRACALHAGGGNGLADITGPRLALRAKGTARKEAFRREVGALPRLTQVAQQLAVP